MRRFCTNSRTLGVLSFLALLGISLQSSWAGKPSCQKCGCQQHLKRVCHLAAVCQDVEMPTYGCSKRQTFYPHKGQVCHKQYRCDTYCTLHKTCDCGKDGGSTLTCCCRTECGCKTLYGALPTGCHQGTCVQQPTGTTVTQLPMLRWVTSYVCDDCCAKGKRGK